MNVINENEKGSAEAATSPSHGYPIPEQESGMSGLVSNTVAADVARQMDFGDRLSDLLILVSLCGDLLERMFERREASSPDGYRSYTFSEDQLDAVQYLIGEAEGLARNAKREFVVYGAPEAGL